jgi:hypothetical protein
MLSIATQLIFKKLTLQHIHTPPNEHSNFIINFICMIVFSTLNTFFYSSPKYMIQFRYVVCEEVE